MKCASLFLTGAIAFTTPLVSMGQTTIFSDDFSNGSTLNGTSTPGGTPTASSTSYDIAATKAATTGPAIAAGDLTLKLNSTTTGGFLEAQALFTSTPVTLTTMGDYINLTYVFKNTSGTVLAGGASSYIFNGLYNSGGSAPVAGALNNSGLNITAASAYATGNAANWRGFVGRTAASTGNNQLYTRPIQNGAGTTSANQDLIGNNLGGGAYNNPTGALLNQAASTVTLTADAIYTVSYQLTLSDVGTLAITNTLYAGNGTAGTVLSSQGITVAGANLLTTTFDGLAIGLRNSGTSFNPTMDISQITITGSIQPVPEPSIFALAGLGMLGFTWMYRRPRR